MTAPLSEQDVQRFEQEFGRWFIVDADRAAGFVRLSLKHDWNITHAAIRHPNDTLESFIDRFLPFAWRTLWAHT